MLQFTQVKKRDLINQQPNLNPDSSIYHCSFCSRSSDYPYDTAPSYVPHYCVLSLCSCYRTLTTLPRGLPSVTVTFLCPVFPSFCPPLDHNTGAFGAAFGTAYGALRGQSSLLYALHLGIGYAVFGGTFSCKSVSI